MGLEWFAESLGWWALSAGPSACTGSGSLGRRRRLHRRRTKRLSEDAAQALDDVRRGLRGFVDHVTDVGKDVVAEEGAALGRAHAAAPAGSSSTGSIRVRMSRSYARASRSAECRSGRVG